MIRHLDLQVGHPSHRRRGSPLSVLLVLLQAGDLATLLVAEAFLSYPAGVAFLSYPAEAACSSSLVVGAFPLLRAVGSVVAEK